MQPNILHLYLMIKVLTFFVETSFQNFLTDLGDVCSARISQNTLVAQKQYQIKFTHAEINSDHCPQE